LVRPGSSPSSIDGKKAKASTYTGEERFLPVGIESMSRFLKMYHIVLRGFVYFFERWMGAIYLGKHVSSWSGVRSSRRPIVVNAGSMTIGNGFRVLNYYAPVEISCSKGAVIDIGTNVHVNYGVFIGAQKSVRIGNNVMIGNMSIIADSVFPSQAGQTPPADDEPKGIEVGDDVWLAVRVVVLPGSKIGRGSVIGAGSIVSGEIPPGVIAIGNPARPVFRIKASSGGATDMFARRAPPVDTGPVIDQ